MQSLEMIKGFSELKDLLIETYKIDREKIRVKLYFSETAEQIVMHDYDVHQRPVIVCPDRYSRRFFEYLGPSAKKLVEESVKHSRAAEFLNLQFKLCGSYRV